MLQKKVCWLGAFAVGKTSLVSRYVHSVFAEKYLTTVGVKIDQKKVAVGATEVRMLLWDLAGEDEFHQVLPAHLRGASGYVLVVDGTRLVTLETALQLYDRMVDEIGDAPFVVLINKADVAEEWEVDDPAVTALSERGWTIFKTSAKTGCGVEDAFLHLAGCMVQETP